MVKRAADQGVAGAQYNYAVYLEKGIGVEQDRGQAAEYYRRAMEGGIRTRSSIKHATVDQWWWFFCCFLSQLQFLHQSLITDYRSWYKCRKSFVDGAGRILCENHPKSFKVSIDAAL
jgi:hypothetical protein